MLSYPKAFIFCTPAQEWSEIKTHASGLLGRDYFSTNVLRFNKKSKYAILMLGGWQSHNEVTEEVWMCTEEHNKKGTFLNCETKNLVSFIYVNLFPMGIAHRYDYNTPQY